MFFSTPKYYPCGVDWGPLFKQAYVKNLQFESWVFGWGCKSYMIEIIGSKFQGKSFKD